MNIEIKEDSAIIEEQEKKSEEFLKEIKEIYNDTKIKRDQMKDMKQELYKEE